MMAQELLSTHDPFPLDEKHYYLFGLSIYLSRNMFNDHVRPWMLSKLSYSELKDQPQMKLLAKHVWLEFIQSPNKSDTPSGQKSNSFLW